MAAAGTGGSPLLPRGSQVVIVVSQGPSPTPPESYTAVPGVTGQPQGDALTSLQAAGLRTRVFTDFSTTHPKGKVTGQVPRANASVPAGSEVNLLVSNGPADAQQGLVALPETVGSSAADASSALQAAGLNPQVANEFSQTVPAGVVMDQLPRSTDLAAAPKKTSPWLWVAIVVAVVVIAAGAFFFLRGSQAEMVPGARCRRHEQDEATTALTDAASR